MAFTENRARKIQSELSDCMGIYAIINQENLKSYIGSSANIRMRWRGHKSDLSKSKHHSRYLQRAFDKSPNSFQWEVIEVVENKTKLVEREQFWMDFYKSYKRENGYNIETCAGSSVGVKWPLERRIAASIQRTGRKYSEESKERMRIAQRKAVLTRKKISPELREKLSLIQSQRKLPESQKEKIRNWSKENIHPCSRVVLQFSMDGEFIMGFKNMTLANETVTGKKRKTGVGTACSLPTRSGYGFKWRFF